ncbi:MAG: methyltransferase domain-containing protein [Gammaproteobacteria bacterium]|nr:methyltransferase domain-containing protein [Gammaproteobacteria bacterium]
MTHETNYYTSRTLASWNEAAPRHESINASLFHDILDSGFNNLNPDFDKLVDRYDVSGRSVVQVCCNNGVDLLSIRNKGAGRCLGIDGSNAFIEQAMTLSKHAGQSDIEFLCSDVYELPTVYQSEFEVVIITVGVVNWMPDITGFMEICASLLAPGGTLLMEEIHPILGMYEEGNPSFLNFSYFNDEPFRDTNGLDYFNYEKYDARENFSFHHSLTDILMSAIANRLTLEHVKELHYNVGNFCADLEFIDNNPPLGINLAWRK